MVDAVVSFVVERLGDYLIQEAVFLRGVRDEVQLLKNELEWMQCFIKDAEEKQVEDAMIRKWVSDIRDIAYDIEDVLDTFLLKVHDGGTSNMLEVDGGGSLERRPGLFASILKCSCISNQDSSPKRSSLYSKGKEAVNLHSIGKEIEALKQRINDLSHKRELYGLQNIVNNREEKRNALDRLKQLRRATSFVVEENVVGFEDDARVLLAKLLQEEPRRLVVSIFGMGGLGKTTLAKKLYHSHGIKNKFKQRAWISVSQDYNTRDLLLKIIESFKSTTTEKTILGSFMRFRTEELQKMSEEDLERCLHKSLQGCSYLVVIDDIWQKEAWESLRRSFPDDESGSRIIMTTRIKEVAECSDKKTYAHKLRFLRPDESWLLFSKYAFQNFILDEGLERLGREMVHKCGGLPLAIVVLAGLLATKSPQEWHLVHDHIWRYLRKDSIHISHLLSLSFNDLSYQLKLCFLYMGLFPEDSEINADTIIQLLVAEGFILSDEDRSMEEAAEDNLSELINRNLIQAGNKWMGMVEAYRVHDLLRDLAIQKAKDLNFFNTYDETIRSSCSSVRSPYRRQAIYCESARDSWVQRCNPVLRSLLLFDFQSRKSPDIRQSVKHFSSNLRLLRVLHVEGRQATGEIKGLPKDIEKLIHLKYLSLTYVDICRLPSSIGNLQSLQTLNLLGNGNRFFELPTEICKLRNLRHLIGRFRGPLAIENLTNLQTLMFPEYESWSQINTEKLVSIRELRIVDKSKRETEYTLDSVAKLKNLQFLVVVMEGDRSLPSLLPLSQCRYLSRLGLEGMMEKLPEGVHELLPKLECLPIEISHLKKDPMPVLEKLPNLVLLDLWIPFYGGKKLLCKAKGFPRLEILRVKLNVQIEEWQVEEGAMPMLKGLRIDGEIKERIPERLSSIPPPDPSIDF